MFDSLNRVDWDLLNQQKRVLIEQLSSNQFKPSVTEALSGIVNLLDALQDDAAAEGRWTFPGERPHKGGA